MKSLTIGITSILIASSASAFNIGKYYPSEMPNCPASSEQLLDVTKFLTSANSGSKKGICYVKANYYSWWDLINEQQIPYEIEVEAGICNTDDFLKYEGKTFIKGTVSYKGEVSMCGSNPGCHYECKPTIELWSL